MYVPHTTTPVTKNMEGKIKVKKRPTGLDLSENSYSYEEEECCFPDAWWCQKPYDYILAQADTLQSHFDSQSIEWWPK